MNKSVQHVNSLRDVTIISNSRSSLCCDDNDYSTVGDSNISEGRHVSTGRFSAFLIIIIISYSCNKVIYKILQYEHARLVSMFLATEVIMVFINFKYVCRRQVVR